MSTVPQQPSDDYDPFGHFLDYQQTEEFKQELADSPKYWKNTPEYYQENHRRYRERHPTFSVMRQAVKMLKPELYTKQNGLCGICGKPLSEKYEMDHIVPLVKGGTNDLANLQVVHGKCNRRKGAR